MGIVSRRGVKNVVKSVPVSVTECVSSPGAEAHRAFFAELISDQCHLIGSGWGSVNRLIHGSNDQGGEGWASSSNDFHSLNLGSM